MSNFKIVRNFFNFKEDQDLVSLLNESMVYFSPRFRKKISKIDSPITKELLNIEGSDIKDDISFIDFAEQEGMFTFKTMKNFKNAFDKSAEITKSWGGNVDDRYYQIGNDFEKTKSLVDEYFEDEHSNISQARNPFKIGRFLTAVLGSKFSNRDIEDFTNKYKALQSDSAEKIIEVEGDEIAKWYDSKNYERLESTLGNSCMKYVPASYFKIYTQNPEICKMVCIISDGKLTARALLWKPVKKVKMFYTQELGFEWFMDRQYATSDAGIQKLRDYAVSKGYAYKTYNTTHNIVDVTYNGQVEKADMLVQLKDLDYSIFPYVDTLKKYDPENKTLQNDDDNSKEGYYLLISTGGGYEVTGEQDEDDDSYVWSEFYGEDVDRDYAVWSDIYDSYLNIDLSIEVTSGSRRYRDWYPEGADELRWDGWNDEYIHEDDAIYSEEYGHYLLEDEAISVVKEIDDSGDCQQDCYFIHEEDNTYIKYKKLSNTFWFYRVKEHFDNYQNHDGVLKETLFQDPVLGEWLPKNFTVEVYSIKGKEVFREEEHLVLSRLDMEILDIEDYTTSSEMDKLGYDDYLLDFGMTDKLIKKLESIERNTLYQMRYEQLVAMKKGEFPKY